MILNKIKHGYIDENKNYWRGPKKGNIKEINLQKILNKFNVFFNDEKRKIKENEDKITLDIFKAKAL